jgi:hypothetical protein
VSLSRVIETETRPAQLGRTTSFLFRCYRFNLHRLTERIARTALHWRLPLVDLSQPVTMADGSVKFINKAINPKLLKKLITIDGGDQEF